MNPGQIRSTKLHETHETDRFISCCFACFRGSLLLLRLVHKNGWDPFADGVDQEEATGLLEIGDGYNFLADLAVRKKLIAKGSGQQTGIPRRREQLAINGYHHVGHTRLGDLSSLIP